MSPAQRSDTRSKGTTSGRSCAVASAIAIDGPSAAGKTAVGTLVAHEMGYRFIDTGMMYRAVTWLALQREIDLHDEEALANLAQSTEIAVEAPSDDAPGPGRVLIDGKDVTDRLRTTEVGEAVSLVSRVPAVREAMVVVQRRPAAEGGVVMAGRDIGTVVMPDAALKVYLDASLDERVRRRHEELAAMDQRVSLQDVREELELRDTIDSERAASPLRPADDAKIIDTDPLSLDQVVERILELVPCRS